MNDNEIDYDTSAAWAIVDIAVEDVKRIIHYRPGENDDSSWLYVLESREK